MAITMAKLCEDARAKYDMQLIAGKGGIENTVRWVHMVEDREVPDFLHGGELIFTTGIGHIESDDRMLEFTRNLHAHGAAGVVFNIGPYIKRIPPDVVKFADENDFPVFTLPWRVHIIDITYDFCGRIIENEKAEMSLMQAFKNLIFSPERKDEYLPAIQKNGFAVASHYRVFALTFFSGNGKKVTTPVFSKNKTLLWRIFARSDSPVAKVPWGGVLYGFVHPKAKIKERLGLASDITCVTISDWDGRFVLIFETVNESDTAAFNVSEVDVLKLLEECYKPMDL